MAKTGVCLLTTNGGERKMFFAEYDGKILSTTDSDTSKVEQMLADNRVKLDLSDNEYIATLHTDTEEAKEILAIYMDLVSDIPVDKYVKSENPTVIVMEEVKA